MSALPFTIALASAALLALACDKGSGTSPAPASASAVAVAPPAPSAPVAPERPWFAGSWTGRFRAEAHHVALGRKEGAPRAWEESKPPRCAGDVTLALDVDQAGTVTGSGTGALGTVRIQGVVEGDALKARIEPVDRDAFRGTLVATRKDSALGGELRTSSSDSLELCKATLSLERKP